MKISINGVETDYQEETADYDDIAVLVAFDEGWQPPIPLLSITYSWRGDGDVCRGGILSPMDKPIKLADGMRFSAYQTGNA